MGVSIVLDHPQLTGSHHNYPSTPQALASLAPEEQSGIEAGVDAIWGDRLTVALTRFDQHASGLVQPVAVLDYGGGSRPPAPGARARVLYQLQNVGAIDNRGWEMQARTAFGPLALASTFTLVSSRVSRLATGYLGDLAVGDRMLEVPARTAGLSAAWTASRWSAVGSLARAFDWVNYDKVALATTIAADATGERIPVGTALRAYWRSYEGNAHASLRLSYAMLPRSWISVSGDNLLNHQVGEPDDITVVPGRTLGLGLRTAF